jgi:2-methylcitrate dehydratase PrpD
LTKERNGLTRTLAHYSVASRYEDLPEVVQHEATRALLNWVGVALGGCREYPVRIAAELASATGGRSQATVLGQGVRTDPASAAFVNCIASSVLAYDDAHLPSVAHPSGPAVASLIAIAQARQVSGAELLNAIALGIEIQCRVANMLVLPPSPFHPSIYINGFSGPIGVAAAVARVIGLDETRTAWAIGLAASQASGFRATHGTMTAHFRPGHATRAGVLAALLAERGFDCTDTALEAPGGFVDVFAPGADASIALDGLGNTHLMLTNRYKPYPCGIVIHPVIDACLELRAAMPKKATPAQIRLRVNPAVLTLTGKRSPRTTLESHVSVFHWVAVVFLRDRAGLAETEPACISDPEIGALREQIEAVADPAIGKSQAWAEAVLADGSRFQAQVRHARGSLERPLQDGELDVKFRDLAGTILPPDEVEQLRQACWSVASMANVEAGLGVLLP